jgi:hypothetical protein
MSVSVSVSLSVSVSVNVSVSVSVSARVSVTFWCAAFSPSSILFSSSNPLSSLQVQIETR